MGYQFYCFVGGFELAKVWAAERDDAEVMVSVFGGEVCDSFEQCSDDVDLAFIPDCNGDGSNHLELASPGLEKRAGGRLDSSWRSRQNSSGNVQHNLDGT